MEEPHGSSPHRMQNMWAVLRVMACSQNTCSGHCTTALLRMRFIAYMRLLVSSAPPHPGVKARLSAEMGSKCQGCDTGAWAQTLAPQPLILSTCTHLKQSIA